MDTVTIQQGASTERIEDVYHASRVDEEGDAVFVWKNDGTKETYQNAIIIEVE